ncbi:extracellular solute-binding protein [Streptomyces sp. KL116D]|uniref:extracellular solute-binding protein n=1 Tax=Streptomyces sp. KL116D TaxID=3045152 RepID=UPI003558194A
MPGISRRTVLRTVAVAGAAAAASPLLTACSDSSGGGDVTNAGKKQAPWPAYKAPAGAKPDLAPTEAGVQAGYTRYPSDLATAVKRTPGDGSTIRVMSVTFGTPPKAAAQNQYWKAVEKALGIKIEYTVIPQADYQKKMATVMAGDADRLPDIINMFSGYTLPREQQFVQTRAQDLTPYLSGDAVGDYPNLAGIPTHAWRDMGRIGGQIYGIPLERPVTGSTLWVNQGMFEDAGMKDGWTDDDFAAVAKKATHGKTYALGAAVGSNFCNGVHSAAHRAPQGWAVDKSGAFHAQLHRRAVPAGRRLPGQLRKNARTTRTRRPCPPRPQHAVPQHGTVGSMQNGFGAYTTAVPGHEGTADAGTCAALRGRRHARRPRRGPPFLRYTILKKARRSASRCCCASSTTWRHPSARRSGS